LLFHKIDWLKISKWSASPSTNTKKYSIIWVDTDYSFDVGVSTINATHAQTNNRLPKPQYLFFHLLQTLSLFATCIQVRFLINKCYLQSRSQYNTVGVVTVLRDGMVWVSNPGRKGIFLFFKRLTPVLRFTQPPIQRVPWVVPEGKPSGGWCWPPPPSSVQVISGAINLRLPCALVTWRTALFYHL
jgi:hypothetical protein